MLLGRDNSRAGAAGYFHKIAQLFIFIECREANLVGQLSHGLERAEIERLYDHARTQVVAVDRLEYQFRETLGRWRVLGLIAKNLGFDIEQEIAARGQ